MDFASALRDGDQFYQSGQAEAARLAWVAACGAAGSLGDFLAVINRFLSLGFLTEAEAALARLPVDELSAPVLAARAALALERGHVREARTLFEQGLPLQHLRMMSNALLVRHYETPIDAAGLLQASRQWAAIARTQMPAIEAPKIGLGGPAKSRLRIGFVSGDLCAHPVGFLIAPLLRAFHARADEVDLFVFDNGVQNDWMTAQLKACCKPDHWQAIAGLSDEEASRRIVACHLDALIDCAGHTSRSRLSLFVNRLAPLQISWGGYFSTTGLETIDAVVMDDHHLAHGIEEHFTEKLLRVPSRFIYAPPSFCPPVTDVPFFRHGTITFGSFNNVAKINDGVIATWAKILDRVPGSRLILKWRCFADAPFCDVMRSRFVSHGIDGARIELRPFSIYRDELAEYRDIDIALDPFPFTGGQTSLDALWMGIPLVTLAGFTPVERQGHAFVKLIGRPEWSASNEMDYVNIACHLSQNPDALRSLRFDQRSLIHASKLSDASSFVDRLLGLILQA